MNFSDLDSVLGVLNAAAKIALLAVLIWRRLYRPFPVFTALILWDTLTDPFLLWIIRAHNALYAQSYFMVLSVDYLLEIAVLAEIAFSVLRPPKKKSLPKGVLYALAVIVIAVGLAAFFFATHANAATFTHPRTVFVVDSSVAILRLVTFLAIAGFAQVLGLGWKHHVLQMASGFAFYAAVDLIVTSLQNRLHAGPDYAARYHSLSQFLLAGYLCSMYFWCFTFVQKEAPRKEFSPQMAQFLVSISGGDKRQR
ncbi:hypothetical protein [Paracidobacterium acidisoli]|uniref:Uncharacterized protein n=1 Tax=Paracidobacterium acidisoli TaxID=2303751 RepID=A0A372IIQ5_9BACT|nr:hypothetical protein [Paracidobacterium acidisoli]MBT9333365.1 hypothetical protein [Paracidobacterium acidisoli]